MHRLTSSARYGTILLILMAAALPALAQWQATGPAFEKIVSFASDGDYDYAGSNDGSGVYRSSDGGRTWTQFSSGLQSGNSFRPVLTMAAAGGVILAGTNGGFYRSTDRGETWTAGNEGLPPSNYAESAVAVGDAFVVVTGPASGHRLYASTDGGIKWTAFAEGMTRQDARTTIYAVGDTLWMIGLRAGSGRHQIFRTTDLGTTWAEFALPGRTPPSVTMAYSNGRLFAGGYPFVGIFYSDDAGETWSVSHQNASAERLAAIGPTVVADVGRTVMTSTDHGVTWTSDINGLPNVIAALHGPFENGTHFFASHEQAYPFRSTDGLSWEPAGFGMRQEFLMNGLVAKGDTLVGSYNLGLFWSNDGGRHWYVPDLPSGTGPIRGVLATDSTFLAFGQLSHLRSKDGRSWQKIATPSGWNLERTFVTERAIYAATQRAGLQMSTDGGYTWTRVAGSPGKLADVSVRGDVILGVDASPSTPLLAVSRDAGATWQRPAGVNSATVATTETMFFSAIDHVFARQKLWSSPDGETWTELVSPGPIARLFAHGKTLFANLASRGVSWSLDDGLTWQGDATGFPPNAAYSASQMLVLRDTLYMAVGGGSATGGVWKLALPTGVVTSAETSRGIPQSFTLQGAYPNPFNPSTTIGYVLPEAAHVRLTVYDMLGREVAVLVDGRRAGGAHSVVFDAGRHASGMFIYRLESGSQSRIRRMFLLK